MTEKAAYKIFIEIFLLSSAMDKTVITCKSTDLRYQNINLDLVDKHLQELTDLDIIRKKHELDNNGKIVRFIVQFIEDRRKILQESLNEYLYKYKIGYFTPENKYFSYIQTREMLLNFLNTRSKIKRTEDIKIYFWSHDISFFKSSYNKTQLMHLANQTDIAIRIPFHKILEAISCMAKEQLIEIREVTNKYIKVKLLSKAKPIGSIKNAKQNIEYWQGLIFNRDTGETYFRKQAVYLPCAPEYKFLDRLFTNPGGYTTTVSDFLEITQNKSKSALFAVVKRIRKAIGMKRKSQGNVIKGWNGYRLIEPCKMITSKFYENIFGYPQP